MSSDPLSPARWADVGLVIALTPFALLMGAPVLGFVVGACAWTLTRALGHLVDRRARRSQSIRTSVGAPLFVGLGRAWIVALAILLVGTLGARADGLTAALVCFFAFSVYLATTVVLRPQPTRKPSA